MSDLAVGEPCHGSFDGGLFYCARCGAKHPRDCITETALADAAVDLDETTSAMSDEGTRTDDDEAAELRKAIQFCRDLKFQVDEFPITVVESLGDGVLGRADKDKREIFISRRCFQDGDLMIASTLIEEWAHIKHGYYDCTREFQNWIFGALVRMGQAYLYERAERELVA